MSISLGGGQPHRFRGWEIRPDQRLLVVNGVQVDVGARAFDLLLVLAARRAAVVSKDELLAAVWPGRVVEENNISVHIATLRKILGARAIATVQGIGYRLIAEVEAESEQAVSERPHSSRVARPVNAQPRSPLIGREIETSALLTLVERCPLICVTGPGGVGKTSLARYVAEQYALQDGDATHWIDLSPLRSPDTLPDVVAAEIGVASHSTPNLLAVLTRTRALICLDNCEHLAAEVASLIGLALKAAPMVRWLVTSQVPLHLVGEHVFQLQSLQVPTQDIGFAEAIRAGALALLRNRVASGYKPFELNPGNYAAAIEICRRLDGLPLAIEMAASRIATLGLADVLEQLNQKLRLSSHDPSQPERQRTLERTLEWSYGLLTPNEQRMFRCMEPFVGGFTAGMARQMIVGVQSDLVGGSQDWDALESLSVLVERSLVHRKQIGTRFFMFESAREYARERQRQVGDEELMHRRHAEVIANLFTSARRDLDHMRDIEWSAKYLPELHNVRLALTWACKVREPDLLARLSAALAQIDTFSRSPAEVVRFDVPLETLLAASPRWRAQACMELSWAHFLDGHRQTGTALARQSVQDFRSLNDPAGTYQALAQLARLYESRPAMMSHALQADSELCELDEEQVPLRSRLFRAITGGLQYAGGRTVKNLHGLHDLARRSGFDTLAAVCRVHITDQLLIDRQYEEMVQAALQFDLEQEPRPRVRATIQANLVLALIRLGRVSEAAMPARAVIRALPQATYHLLAAFALAAIQQRDFENAAVMMGYYDRVRRERDQRADPAEAAAETEIAGALSRELLPARLTELRRLGSSISLEEAWSFIP